MYSSNLMLEKYNLEARIERNRSHSCLRVLFHMWKIIINCITMLMISMCDMQHPGFDFSQAEFTGNAPDPSKFMGGIRQWEGREVAEGYYCLLLSNIRLHFRNFCRMNCDTWPSYNVVHYWCSLKRRQVCCLFISFSSYGICVLIGIWRLYFQLNLWVLFPNQVFVLKPPGCE